MAALQFDSFLTANEAYAATFDRRELAPPPARRVAVVACMDARLQPERALGLEVGDAHVIRNAGGRAQDAIRSLVISEQLLGTTEIVVLHHTDCGMVRFTNEQLAARVKARLGADASHVDFYPFADLEQSVRDDVAILRASPLIPKDIPITGAIYEIETGKVREVVRA